MTIAEAKFKFEIHLTFRRKDSYIYPLNHLGSLFWKFVIEDCRMPLPFFASLAASMDSGLEGGATGAVALFGPDFRR